MQVKGIKSGIYQLAHALGGDLLLPPKNVERLKSIRQLTRQDGAANGGPKLKDLNKICIFFFKYSYQFGKNKQIIPHYHENVLEIT